MRLRVLPRDEIIFPHPFHCAPDGLLCIGGDLSPERLLLAYQFGIFPWYNEGEPLLWWTPYPRMVLKPEDLKVSKSMKSIIRKEQFRVSFNQEFDYVVSQCQTIKRHGQGGTWITPAMRKAYNQLYKLGYAHSVEVWEDNSIVGGLYGIALGKIFYGESMFHHVPNASKMGFITLCQTLLQKEFALIDCQQETAYMASFGAAVIPKEDFMDALRQNALLQKDQLVL